MNSDVTVFEDEVRTDASHNPVTLGRYRIPNGAQVEVYPLAGNTNNCFIATNPAAASGGGARKVIQNNQLGAITYYVEQLSELWLYSTVVGEGVTVRVNSAGGAAQRQSAGQPVIKFIDRPKGPPPA